MIMDNELQNDVIDNSVDTSALVDSPATTDQAIEAPKTMLEAMEAVLPKAEESSLEIKKEEEKKPEEIAKPDAAEDLTKIPEGLSQKAQDRFQRLANENKEVKGELENIRSQIEPFHHVLRENKVTAEQFNLATQYIGLVNAGRLEDAYRVMEQELRELGLKMGKPLGAVDPLAAYPDLRQAVDQFQITEAHAIQLAQQTAQNQQREMQDQRATQAQQQQHEQKQLHEQGVRAIDEWSKKMAASDMDYPAAEKLLQGQLVDILQGTHPSRWVSAVDQAYKLIKAGAGTVRQAPSTTVLRPTGQASPGAAPKNMFDAMFGAK